ncbi:MAG: phage portal protein, partial [Firmicutes bacterium]|nr:phage portal protein [Bacillota bacterium]
SNIEHQSIEFMVHTIGPWLVRWEQALNWKLLTAKERTRYFVEFLVEGLLRGDTKSRYEAYSIGRQWGWLSANDIRERENMNPIPGGDVYLIPLNMIPASHAGTVEQQRMLAAPVRALTPPEVRATKPGMRRVRAAVSFRTVFEDAARRIVAREARDIGRALRTQLQARAQADFERWLEGYYAEAPAWIGPIMQPAVRALADVIQAEAAEEIGAEPLGMTPELEDHVRGYTAIYAEEHVRHSRTQIAYLLEHEDDPAEAIAGRLEEWQKNRPGKIALKETVQANSVIARFVFASLGVMALRWSALGPDPCPYCRAMDGKVVSMSGFFALGGGSLQPEGQPPMTFGHNVRHPPLHEGCECTVTAAL